VHPDAVVIGSVVIGAQSSVWPTAVLRGDDGFIYVGARSSIQDGSIIHTHPFWPTTIGDDCTIGHKVHLEGCTIEDKALVGSGSVVLHNARVGREAIVGACAFVGNNKVVPPWPWRSASPPPSRRTRSSPAISIWAPTPTCGGRSGTGPNCDGWADVPSTFRKG